MSYEGVGRGGSEGLSESKDRLANIGGYIVRMVDQYQIVSDII